MNPTLIYNLYDGIRNSGNTFCVLSILFTKIICSCIICVSNYYQFKIMEKIDNRDSVLHCIYIITALWTIHQFIFDITFRVTQNLEVDLQQFFREKYLKFLILKSNLDWLNVKNSSTINDAIDKGTNALLNTLRFSIEVINPLIQTIGSCIIINKYIGFDIIYVVFSFVFVLTIGIFMLRWEFYKREEVNIKNNPLYSYNNKLSGTLIVNILNGEGKKSVQTIIDNSIKSRIEHKNITLKVQTGYTINELSGYIVIFLLIKYIISSKVSIPILVASYTAINNSLNKIWWLFHMFNSASQQAAEWGPIKKYIIEHIPKKENYTKSILYNYSILNNDVLEYKIMGESGKGKSTWMRQEIIRLYRNHIVNWIYFDQNMIIPKSKLVKIYNFLNKDKLDISYNCIFQWAKVLKLEGIINENTINKPFNKPSGGETKRIIILQKLLPILLHFKTVKVIFCDEITAGLDEENQQIIRNLLEILKTKYGIKIVNIDHHKITSDNLLRLNVKITDFKVHLPKKDKTTIKKYYDFGYSKAKDNTDEEYLPPIVEIY